MTLLEYLSEEVSSDATGEVYPSKKGKVMRLTPDSQKEFVIDFQKTDKNGFQKASKEKVNPLKKLLKKHKKGFNFKKKFGEKSADKEKKPADKKEKFDFKKRFGSSKKSVDKQSKKDSSKNADGNCDK